MAENTFTYVLELDDGTELQIDGPEGLSLEDVVQRVVAQNPDALKQVPKLAKYLPKKEEPSLGEAVWQGTKMFPEAVGNIAGSVWNAVANTDAPQLPDGSGPAGMLPIPKGVLDMIAAVPAIGVGGLQALVNKIAGVEPSPETDLRGAFHQFADPYLSLFQGDTGPLKEALVDPNRSVALDVASMAAPTMNIVGNIPRTLGVPFGKLGMPIARKLGAKALARGGKLNPEYASQIVENAFSLDLPLAGPGARKAARRAKAEFGRRIGEAIDRATTEGKNVDTRAFKEELLKSADDAAKRGALEVADVIRDEMVPRFDRWLVELSGQREKTKVVLPEKVSVNALQEYKKLFNKRIEGFFRKEASEADPVHGDRARASAVKGAQLADAIAAQVPELRVPVQSKDIPAGLARPAVRPTLNEAYRTASAIERQITNAAMSKMQQNPIPVEVMLPGMIEYAYRSSLGVPTAIALARAANNAGAGILARAINRRARGLHITKNPILRKFLSSTEDMLTRGAIVRQSVPRIHEEKE